MYYLTISAVFRQENQWLEEWIRYHQKVGVEHFYLYNNDIDSAKSDCILQPFVEQGLVENIRFPGTYIQLAQIQDAMRRAIHQTFWLALIDLDEFILARQYDDIRDVLRDYETYSGLAVNWSIFGTNGYYESPPDQINHLLRRAEETFSVNRHIKSIIQPQYAVTEMIADPHAFQFHTGYAVGEKYDPVHSPWRDYSADKIRINHYALRSVRDFWDTKVARGQASPIPDRDQDFFDAHDRNEVFDDEISHRFGKQQNRERELL
ncbi:MAG: glycosyltransferase family 92 protein [Planctomycetaceae bacterium]|jgi:hypothetical protein|nr:glycosyltransferase family 92 protein [Planctomycetaceae bacterium]